MSYMCCVFSRSAVAAVDRRSDVMEADRDISSGRVGWRAGESDL